VLTEPMFVELSAKNYVAVRMSVTIPFADDVPPAFDELFESLEKAGVETDGMEFFRYNLIDMPRMEIDVALVTDVVFPLSGRLVRSEIPGGKYASMTYTGPHDGLVDATAQLIDWAKANDVRWDVEATVDGDRFASRLEVYENNPGVEPDPQKLVTTILIKVADD
jgi:effector-binding domain-containing protein